MGINSITGMGRKEWIEAGLRLLEGYMSHLSRDGYLMFPDAEKIFDTDGTLLRQANMHFEAFGRFFMLAAPLLKIYPDLEFCGIGVRSYCKNQIDLIFNPASDRYVGMPEGHRHSFHQVCWSSLVMSFMLNDNIVWNELSEENRDRAVKNLTIAAHHHTAAHNWRFFNILEIAFLRLNGYDFDPHIEEDHLLNLLAWYAGDGWYRDGAEFDYYNAWAFQSYAVLWIYLGGRIWYPDIAAAFERNFREFIVNYIHMFSKEGFSLLWGRSSIYRFAASAPLAAAFLLDDPPINGGFARRLMSGNLQQFIGRGGVFDGGVPVLGYYRTFRPMLQRYAKGGAFGWMHKAFLCLELEEESTFWIEPENEGFWEGLSPEEVVTTELPGPGQRLYNFAASGVTVLSSSKSWFMQNENYTRLAYNSHFLWEKHNDAGPSAMCYGVINRGADEAVTMEPRRLIYAGTRDGVLYRQLVLGKDKEHFTEWAIIDLAEVAVPNGIVRVDRIRIPFAYDLTLGTHGVPVTDGALSSETEYSAGEGAAWADSGGRAAGIVNLLGWDDSGCEEHRGMNAESVISLVPYLRRTRTVDHQNGISLCSSLHLFTTRGESMKELIKNYTVTINNQGRISPLTGSPFTVELRIPGGETYQIDFGTIEGQLMLTT